jgi:RNA polymerase sigma-70 factor (ECF subfamily)
MARLSQTDEADIAAGSGSSGNSGADFDSLYRAEVNGLIRFFRRRLRSQDEAEDMAHDTLTQFLRASPVTQIHKPAGYLKRIAVNLLINRSKRAETQITDFSVTIAEAPDDPSSIDQHRELIGREDLEHYTRVLQQLHPRTLEIFLLSRVEGYTYKMIAAELGITLRSVKRRMLEAIAFIDQHRRGE